MSIITTELRYFRQAGAQLPAPLDALRRYLHYEGERSDHYLAFEQCTTCGVKLREGRLEVKCLLNNHQEPLAGIQSWEKLLLENPPEVESTLTVHKKRWLKFFDQNLHAVKPEGNRHCQVEISELRLGNTLFHSFCLEAAAPQEWERLHLLHQVYQHLLANCAGLHELLADLRPSSYPEFLLARA